MNVLIIDKDACKNLYEHARKNPVDIKKLPVLPIGDNPLYRIYLGSFRVVFSFETQPTGLFRHLSVSLFPTKKGKFPAPIAVNELLKEFSFKNTDIQNPKDKNIVHLWIDDEFQAINVLEKVNDESIHKM